MNDIDSIVVNRNLVILFALLRSGPSVDEAAELAVHLMYSAALPPASSAYLDQCIDTIYGMDSNGDMSFQARLSIRGNGNLHSMQTAVGIRQSLEMFHSTYELSEALENMRDVFSSPSGTDHRDLFFSKLKPTHRLAFERFRKTGVLAPFSLQTSTFTHPNR